MFEVGAYGDIRILVYIVEPILSLYVVCLLLFGVECRGEERERGVLSQLSCNVECSEESAEEVFLLSVEIHLELLHLFECAERRLAVVGHEVEVVF